MNVRLRFVSVLAVGAALLGTRSASAQTFSFCSFSNSNFGQIHHNGSAGLSGTMLQLTPNLKSQVGSAYFNGGVPFTAATDFHTSFEFQITPNATGAEGLAFIVTSGNTNSIGPDGPGLGYQGIANSVEVEFDTFLNAANNDPNSNHVGIMSGGNPAAHIAVGTPPFTMANGGRIFAWVDYASVSTTLSVYLAQADAKPAAPLVTTNTVNVFNATNHPAVLNVGFTASTGAGNADGTNEHDILEWEFSTVAVNCACGAAADCPAADPICDAVTQLCRVCLSNADCGGATPVCSAGGTCVQCTTNANCSGTTPVCNVATNKCGPCTSDANCAVPKPACELSGPLAGACEQCSSANKTLCVGATPVCDTNTGNCVGCASNADCSGNTPICDMGTLQCRACSGNADCASFAGKVCDMSGAKAGECVVCASNSDCMAPTPTCNLVTNTCSGCNTNADCSGNSPVCNVATHACGPCTSDSNCAAPTPACQMSGSMTGACGQCSSSNATECTGAAPVCDTAIGNCVGCNQNSDCNGSKPICDGTSHACRACQGNGDCAGFAGKVCDLAGAAAGTCVACAMNSDCTAPMAICDQATNTCVACATNADCPSNTPACNPMSHTCVVCMSDSDCIAPTPACQTSGGLAGECTQCSTSNQTECTGATPACQSVIGVCGCGNNSECGSGDVCNTNVPPAGQCAPGDGGTVDGSGGDAGADAGDASAPGMDGGPTVDASPPGMDSGPVIGTDAGMDAGMDGGLFNADNGSIAGGGCGCRTAGSTGEGRAGAFLGLLVLVGTLQRRRRRGTERL